MNSAACVISAFILFDNTEYYFVATEYYYVCIYTEALRHSFFINELGRDAILSVDDLSKQKNSLFAKEFFPSRTLTVKGKRLNVYHYEDGKISLGSIRSDGVFEHDNSFRPIPLSTYKKRMFDFAVWNLPGEFRVKKKS